MSTMPKGARHIKVRGQDYLYLLKEGKGRYLGQSGRTIRLVVELDSKSHVSTIFLSKNFDDDAEMGFKNHKVSITPRDVAQFIEAVLDNEGKVPESFDLDLWSVLPPGAQR